MVGGEAKKAGSEETPHPDYGTTRDAAILLTCNIQTI